MIKRFFFSGIFSCLLCSQVLFSQQVVNGTLIKADKFFIRHLYAAAVVDYIKYLKEYPKDYYASRQTAVCYDKLNNANDAIDYWPVAVESSDATEKDYLQYARCLLANNREPEARKIFILLSHSTNKSIAAWGKAYLNPATFYNDSALCRVTEVNGINSDKPEFCPVIYKEKLLTVRDKGQLLRIYNAITDIETQEINTSLKKDSLTFVTVLMYEKLKALHINSQFCFSNDGSALYFCKAVSNNNLHVNSDSPFWKFQLFTLNMSELDAVNPELKPFKYNSPEYDIMHPSISKDGKKLYFASDMKGSAGGKDIFVCEWSNGDWGPPKNVGSQVNSPGNEVFPHISDEGLLYFVSDTRPGIGGLDLFYAEAAGGSENGFDEAKNCGANINTRFDDFGIYVLPGGKKGYLSSNRKNNTDDDIYFFVNEKSK